MIDFIKDADCTKETPVRLGVPDAPIYGKGIKLKPRVDGRTDSEHFKKIYLPELLPLEEYDLIVVLISGGKDSVACYLKLLELGVPKEKIEFWHHDIDGGHPSRRMDWKCTQNYVKALADAEGIKLRDTIAAKLAECFITIGSRRYNFMQMIDMEAKVEKTKTTVPRLGAIMAGHKSCGMEGTFSGTAHYNQSVLRRALLDYKNTGEDVYFEMQITNDDPTSDAGRQTIIFYDCNTDGGVLAKFDADGEYLDEEIEGTFEDFSMPESFANLTGFLTN